MIALPLTPATRHLFGEEEFQLLGKKNDVRAATSTLATTNDSSAAAAAAAATPSDKGKPPSRAGFLINIARGPLIDQPALIKALNDGTLSGAALDVADPEPLPADHPLWDAKNVIITPHASSLGIEYTQRSYDLFATNWQRKERGERLFNLVDRKKGY